MLLCATFVLPIKLSLFNFKDFLIVALVILSPDPVGRGVNQWLCDTWLLAEVKPPQYCMLQFLRFETAD